MESLFKSSVAKCGRRPGDKLRRAWRSMREDIAAGLTRMRFGRPGYACQRIVSRNLNLEPLEARQLLAANPIISEFLARNDGGLRDGDGRTSDWIEIFNAGNEALDLSGYRLTDNKDDLNKFVFPSVELDAGDYLVVFASGQQGSNYVDPAGNLHTSFTLRRGGDYVALVAPNGSVVAEYGTGGQDFPEQLANVSYGIAQSVTLVTPDQQASYWVPFNDNLGSSWTEPGFDAAANGFTTGTASLGFEAKPNNRTNFVGAFETELPDGTHAVLNRIEFQLGSASAVSNLMLRMKYDNGFVAYLNGVKVASENAPDTLSWFSTAVASSPRDSDALKFVDFDLSDHVDALVDGTNVLAIHGLNFATDTSDMLLVAELQAGTSDMQAATGKPAKIGYMTTPTPGAPNVSSSEIYSGFVGDTQFSVDRGFYYEPFQVEIATATEGAEIRYTTDGTVPTATNGTVYTGPITVSTTTTLRATAFKPDAIPSNTDTQTYVFPEAVMHQDDSYITQETANWGHAGPDWEMDPDVLNSPDPESRPETSDLLTLPTLSLVMNWQDMFGSSGIYIRGESVEKATSIEMINPDGSPGFQIDGSVQIVGGSSPNRWKTDKLSMRLKFSREYGSGDLQFPVFGEDAAQSFDTLVLDNYLNNVWDYGGGSEPTGQRTRAQYLRDAMASDIQNAMGGYASHDKFMYLYIDGIFWGMTRVHERPDDNFAAAYLGGDNKDYDVIKHRVGTVVQGSNDNFRALFEAARKDLTDPANYAAVEQMLDIDNFIDYMLGNFYGGNQDWPHQNWYASFNRVDPNGRWRFHSWDAEKYFHGLRDNVTRDNDANGPGELQQLLTMSPEYRLRFADHAQRFMHNGNVLTPEGMTALYQLRLDEINDAIKIESARWGDNQRATPYTRGAEWITERDRLLNEYFPQRTDIVLDQLAQPGVKSKQPIMPDVEAPTLNQHGGVVPSTMDITLSAGQGTIYYTTDGSDPRLVGGAVAPGAIEYTGPLNLTDNITIKARALQGDEWSALTEADFLLASDVPVRITEINYNPHDANPIEGMQEQDVGNDRFEFIELANVGDQPVNLDGFRLARSLVRGDEQGVVFTFAAQTLQPSERVVVARDREAFQSRYGTAIRIAAGNDGDGGEDGVYGGRLSNQGERLTLVDAGGKFVQQFDYRVRDPWPTRANGRGSSLEIVDPLGSYGDVGNWRASSDFGGSPGAAGQSLERQLVINEVLANPIAPQTAMLELYNPTRQDVDVTNWYLSNSADNYFQSRITDATTVARHGYQVLDVSGLGLDGSRGDQVYLVAADTSGKPIGFVDHVQFGPSLASVSMGPTFPQVETFVMLDEPTFGSQNARARANEVVISEVNYNPVDPDGPGSLRASDFEFVELTNYTDTPVDIAGWQIEGDIEFTFSEGTVIGPGEALTLVRFDPTSGTKATVFRFTLGMDPAAALVGKRIRQSLDDESGVVRLLRPGVPAADDPSFTPMVLADSVSYSSVSPWPASAAAGGESLNRTIPTDHGGLPNTKRLPIDGELPISWVGKTPTPGAAELIVRYPGDANEDHQFDQLDITRVLQGDKYLTGEPATWSDGDWTGDGKFDQFDLVLALRVGRYMQGPLAAVGASAETDAVDAALEQLGQD